MHNPMGMNRPLFLVSALALVVLAALATGPVLERNRRAGEIRVLRIALDQARMSADSCKLTLGWEQEEFLRFDRTVDSLRREVAGLEDPDRGGVPEDVYGEYLEIFDHYNDSVEIWQSRADSLQASDARCRTLVEAHNALRDSIRVLTTPPSNP